MSAPKAAESAKVDAGTAPQYKSQALLNWVKNFPSTWGDRMKSTMGMDRTPEERTDILKNRLNPVRWVPNTINAIAGSDTGKAIDEGMRTPRNAFGISPRAASSINSQRDGKNYMPTGETPVIPAGPAQQTTPQTFDPNRFQNVTNPDLGMEPDYSGIPDPTGTDRVTIDPTTGVEDRLMTVDFTPEGGEIPFKRFTDRLDASQFRGDFGSMAGLLGASKFAAANAVSEDQYFKRLDRAARTQADTMENFNTQRVINSINPETGEIGAEGMAVLNILQPSRAVAVMNQQAEAMKAAGKSRGDTKMSIVDTIDGPKVQLYSDEGNFAPMAIDMKQYQDYFNRSMAIYNQSDKKMSFPEIMAQLVAQQKK